MKRVLTYTGIVLVAGTLLAGCEREDVGMVLGGVAGGAIGSAITDNNAVGTIAGSVGGAYLGRKIAGSGRK